MNSTFAQKLFLSLFMNALQVFIRLDNCADGIKANLYIFYIH